MSIKGIVEPEVLIADPSRSQDHDQQAFASHLEGDAVLACSGELDSAANTELRRSLRRVVRLAPDRVVIDLSQVSYFDAGAIGEFVRARNSSRAAGGDLVVRAPSVLGRRLLGIVGLLNLIDIEPGGDTASVDASAAEEAHGVVLVESTFELAGRFAAANQASIVIEEAKGLIAEHFGIGIDEATAMLRAFATAQQLRMHTVAVALMGRTIPVARLSPHRDAAPVVPEGDTERDAPGHVPSRES